MSLLASTPGSKNSRILSRLVLAFAALKLKVYSTQWLATAMFLVCSMPKPGPSSFMINAVATGAFTMIRNWLLTDRSSGAASSAWNKLYAAPDFLVYCPTLALLLIFSVSPPAGLSATEKAPSLAFQVSLAPPSKSSRTTWLKAKAGSRKRSIARSEKRYFIGFVFGLGNYG